MFIKCLGLERLLAASLICTATGTAWAADCQLNRTATLSVANAGSTLSVVSANLQGRSERLLVDTGTQFDVIPDRLARQLDLTRSTVSTFPQVVFQHETLVEVARDGKLQLGQATIDSVQFFISHRDVLGHSNFDGILGTQFLSNFDLDLNLAQREIGLFSKDHCDGNVVYWAKEYLEQPASIGHFGEITFEVELDGKRLIALLDTGASATILSSQAAERIFGAAASQPGVPETQSVIVAGRLTRLHSRAFQTLSLGGLTIRNPAIYVGDIPDLAPTFLAANQAVGSINKPDIIFGMNYIQLLHIYVSMKEQKLYFTPAEKT